MIEQTIIAVCGVASVFLSQDPRRAWARWACIIGMAAQPFWMYATFKAEQWGIFVLCFIYTAGWARGIKTYWLR